ncbi:MAG: hypothetical protein ACLRP8_04360 [Roseburia intestinalis]
MAIPFFWSITIRRFCRRRTGSIEMGPEAGDGGGYVIAEGSIPEITNNKASMIGPFLAQTNEFAGP